MGFCFYSDSNGGELGFVLGNRLDVDVIKWYLEYGRSRFWNL